LGATLAGVHLACAHAKSWLLNGQPGLRRHLAALDWRNQEGRAAALKATNEAFPNMGWAVADSRKLLKLDS
jgi:hypothetical protein